ncbi:MAG: response regulator transcription factor, partial [Bdellovibrionales bacterium]|nr:response regulator transcription factor [Oligoflexia bacterium]
GYACVWVKTLRDAKQRLDKEEYDAAVVDWNLPDGEGLALLKHPKRNALMVLVLSSKASVTERVEGLTRGADDYLPKPFSFHELEARLLALLRRAPAKEELKKTLWLMDERMLSVEAPTGKVELTPLEFKFLKYLVERKDMIISKDRLLRDVWGFTLLPKTRTVDYVITQLRKRIEMDPETPGHLLTVRGAGVKFIP